MVASPELLDALSDDRPLTSDDFYALPETSERYELFRGMLIVVPPPSFGHQSIVTKVGSALDRQEERSGGHAFVAPTGVTLASDITFEPDAGYIAPGRDEIVRERGIEGPPDIVVEVLSDSTRQYDLHVKLPAYLASGVREVWIIDPQAKTVSVHRADAPDDVESVEFGQRIPSRVVDVGDAGLSRVR